MKGLLIQEFKTLFKSPASLSILIIPLVLLVGLGYLLPSGWIVPSSITIGIVGAVLLYFGGSIEEIKRTSFMKSISLTRMNKMSYLATKILFSVFVSMIAVLWVLFFAWVSADVIGFLATDFSTLIPYDTSAPQSVMNYVRLVPFEIHWDKVNWFMMLYAGMLTITVSVALAFVFVAFSKSSLSFYLMSFGYLLAMILFGGVVMPSFLISADTKEWFTVLYYIIPNYYTNNVMAQSFGGSLGVQINNLADNISLIVGNESILNASPEAIDNATAFFADPNWTDNITAATEWVNDSSNAISEADKEYYLWALELYNSLGELLPEAITLLSNPISNQVANLIDSFIRGLSWKDVKPIIVQLLEGHDDLINFINDNPSTMIAGWIAIKGPLADFIANTLQPHINDFIILISPALGDTISKIVTPTLATNVNINASVANLLGTISGMFNTAQPFDYYVPWIETGIFLGISTVFFKWS